MYKGSKRESVLKEVGGVVRIVGEAKIVGVRVWAMTEFPISDGLSFLMLAGPFFQSFLE